MVESMKVKNPQLYGAILERMDPDAKEHLGELMKIEIVNEEGKQRKIFKITGIKEHKSTE